MGGNVQVITSREVTHVKRGKKGVEVWTPRTLGTNNDRDVAVVDPEEEFGELLMLMRL